MRNQRIIEAMTIRGDDPADITRSWTIHQPVLATPAVDTRPASLPIPDLQAPQIRTSRTQVAIRLGLIHEDKTQEAKHGDDADGLNSNEEPPWPE